MPDNPHSTTELFSRQKTPGVAVSNRQEATLATDGQAVVAPVYFANRSDILQSSAPANALCPKSLPIARQSTANCRPDDKNREQKSCQHGPYFFPLLTEVAPKSGNSARPPLVVPIITWLTPEWKHNALIGSWLSIITRRIIAADSPAINPFSCNCG